MRSTSSRRGPRPPTWRPKLDGVSKPVARAVLVYNLWRLVLFAACLGLLALAGLRSIALLAASLLISGVLSYFLLDRPRRAFAEAVGEAVDRSRQRMAERTAREDAYVDELLARDGAEGVTPLDR